VCLQPLIGQVELALSDESDVFNKQAGILMLSQLIRYLNSESLKDIADVTSMVLSISNSFSGKALVVASLQVLRIVIQQATSSLYKFLQKDLLDNFVTNLGSTDTDIKAEAFKALTTYFQESEGEELDPLSPSLQNKVIDNLIAGLT